MVDSTAANSATWVVFCDGSAVPNPGRMGLGAVLVGPDGTRHTLSQASHATGCNNEAELRAVMAALLALKARGASDVQLFSDNSVLVAQLTQADCKPIARLSALYDEARALLATFACAEVKWVPGHRNVQADELARAALGLPARQPAKPVKGRRRR